MWKARMTAEGSSLSRKTPKQQAPPIDSARFGFKSCHYGTDALCHFLGRASWCDWAVRGHAPRAPAAAARQQSYRTSYGKNVSSPTALNGHRDASPPKPKRKPTV
ncbi:unnamed protein product [Ectocarpus sp. 12 AP-2014]